MVTRKPGPLPSQSEVATGGAQFVGLQKQLWDKPQWRTSVQFF